MKIISDWLSVHTRQICVLIFISDSNHDATISKVSYVFRKIFFSSVNTTKWYDFHEVHDVNLK